VCSVQISSGTDSGHQHGIYLTVPSSECKSRALQPTCHVKLEWHTSGAWKKGKTHCKRASAPSCQQHSAAANVAFVNVQLPWVKISSDSCFWFLRFLHYFQNCTVLPCLPKCCIFINSRFHHRLCRLDPALWSCTNLTDFLGTNPIL